MTKEELIVLMEEEIRIDRHGTIWGYEKVAEKIITEMIVLQDKIDKLQENNHNMSWQLNPDRSGGQFTEEELNRDSRL